MSRRGGGKANIFLLLKQVVKEIVNSRWLLFAPYIAVLLSCGSLYGVVSLASLLTETTGFVLFVVTI